MRNKEVLNWSKAREQGRAQGHVQAHVHFQAHVHVQAHVHLQAHVHVQALNCTHMHLMLGFVFLVNDVID